MPPKSPPAAAPVASPPAPLPENLEALKAELASARDAAKLRAKELQEAKDKAEGADALVARLKGELAKKVSAAAGLDDDVAKLIG